MRVLFWSGTFWPNIGGVEVLSAKLLPALRERGYEYVVVAPKTHAELPDEAQYNGIPIYRFPFRNNLSDRSIDHLMATRQKIMALKRAFAPALIHINAVGVENFFHLTTTAAYRAPVLVTLHGKWPAQADTIVRRMLLDADWVVGCSSAIIEEGRKLAAEITPRSSVIYNAVEVPSLSPAPLPFCPPRLLCLGRIAHEKGFDLALSAFAGIIRQFPDARLVIAGDGPERSALERQAIDQGISKTVEFPGWVSPGRVAELINSSTVVVIPSRQDSLPLVALEAALMARPLVVSGVGGLPEVVIHEEGGLLVDGEDTDGFVRAVSFLLQHPDAAVEMGKAGRRRVQTVFSWDRHLEAYDAVYRKLSNSRMTV
jgi:glycogen(starch) synthase